jgi:hypothetical protein
MAFIAGKGFAILNSKAEKGDQKAKDLLAKLNTIDQDEADRLFSEILGKGGGGGSKKEKKIKAPGASATDGQGEITEGAGEQAPTGKTAPKAKGEAPVAAPDTPTGEVKPSQKIETPEQLGEKYKIKVQPLPKNKFGESAGFVASGMEGGPYSATTLDELDQMLQQDNIKGKPTGEVKPLKQKTKKEIEKEVREYADRATPVDPLSGSNLEKLYNSGLNEKEIINKLNEQIKQNELSEIPNNYRVSAEEFVKEYSKMYGAPKGKVTPKESKPADPLSNENLQTLFDSGLDTDGVIDELRKQTSGLEADPESPLAGGDIQGIVEAFETGYKPGGAAPASAPLDVATPEQIAEDFGISLDEARSIYDEETANELGVDTEQLNELLKPTNTSTPKDPEDPANVQQVLNSVGGDKAKALQIIKGQQAVNGGLQLNEKTIKEVINQVAAGETNLSLPASDPTAEQLAETDSLFENTPEKEMVAAEQLAGQGDAPLSQLTDKIQTKNILSSNESSVEGTLPNGSQFIVTDTGTGLQYQIVNGPDGDEEPLNVGYDEFDNLVDFINNDGKESGQPAQKQQGEQLRDELINSEEVSLVTAEVNEFGDFTAKLPNGNQVNVSSGRDGTREIIIFGPNNEELEVFQVEENSIDDIKDIINEYGETQGQPATFEVADENNLTPDEFQRMDFEAGEAERGIAFEQPPEYREEENTGIAEFENDNERIGGQGFVRLSNNINFDRSVITNEQIKQVAQELGLEGKTPEQLTQIRNGVVKEGEGRQNSKARTALSAITAAIDSYIMGSNRNKPAAKPAQAPAQIKQTAQANAQQAAPAAAAATPQPQQQPGKIDRKKLEQAAGDLGVNADLLEGLLELLKKVR